MAAEMYDSMFTSAEVDRFSALPVEQARSHAIGTLVGFVQAIFPEPIENKPVNTPI
jgi:hypothetical protein